MRSKNFAWRIIYYSILFVFGVLLFSVPNALLSRQKKPLRKIKPRILCYVNTIPQTYFTKAIHVNNTWGRRCTKILFFGSKSESTIPVIDLNLTKPESRMHLWSKMRKILRHVYTYRNDFEFFFKCDDDTYLFYENLVDELSERSASDAFIMGHRFLRFLDVGYMSGGAGYVLSREALIRIVELAIDKHPACPTYDEDKEDVKMSICGSAVGVKLYDAFDRSKWRKFQWMNPDSLFNASKWLSVDRSLLWSPLSTTPISLHYVQPEVMYLIEYFVYFAKIAERGL